jgi:endonuclease/exonuclease/phosphatase family metal-dependent hydrolase
LKNSLHLNSDRYGIRFFAFPALITTLGLQILRVFLPSQAWYLRDTVGLTPMPMVVVAFLPVPVGFLVAALSRTIGIRPMLRLTAGSVAILKFAEQVVNDPLLDMLLSLVGTAAFIAFLPIFIEHVRSTSEREGTSRLAFGLIMGSALDSSIRGLSGTLDLSWVPGVFPMAIIAFMAFLVLWLLWLEPTQTNIAPKEVSWPAALPLLALGPYLWMQTLIFQNQGWISELAGISSSGAFLVLAVGNLLSLTGLLWGLYRPEMMRPIVSLIVGGFLVFGAAAADQPRSSFVIILGVVQFLVGSAWAVLSRDSTPSSRQTLSRTAIVISSSMMLFMLLVLFYYGALGIAFPIPRAALPAVGAGVFGLALLSRTLFVKPSSQDEKGYKAAFLAVTLLTLIALFKWIPSTASDAEPIEGEPSWPIRVLTFNIHSAFASDGRQDPEAIARVIEQSDADIIALQEISRGWLINGSTDLVAWLSQRLGMPFLFKGTTGPMWGNAIVSRYPILDHGSGSLPQLYTLIARGYLWATIDFGGPKPLLVIATHLIQSSADSAVRQEQVPVLLDFWDHAPLTIILGDLNARPEAPEMHLLREAGLIDAWDETNSSPGFTFASTTPIERIDWIWHSPDLIAIDADIIQSTASDHLPLWAVITTAP